MERAWEVDGYHIIWTNFHISAAINEETLLGVDRHESLFYIQRQQQDKP